jgi:hypothetical protein
MSDTNTQTTNANAPTHIAYYVREGSQKGYWNRIGAAWAHKDGKGFNLQLECTPVDGKITLRLASENK